MDDQKGNYFAKKYRGPSIYELTRHSALHIKYRGQIGKLEGGMYLRILFE